MGTNRTKPKPQRRSVRSPTRRDVHPFELAAAVLCERVLEEKDGTLTAVRIIDRLTMSSLGSPDPNAVTVVAPATLALLVIFRYAKADREYEIALAVEEPGGKRTELTPPGRLVPGGATNGANFIGRITFVPKTLGLYRFHVTIDGDDVAAVPLTVVEAPAEKRSGEGLDRAET